jgi:AraC-like DNA-binding protein
MVRTFLNPQGGFFRVTDDFAAIDPETDRKHQRIHLIWNRGNEPCRLILDHEETLLPKDHIITITYLNVHDFPVAHECLVAFSFDRSFYCVKDHDHEVSCNGLIFFGAQSVPFVALNSDEKASFHLLYQVFLEEFDQKDNIQGEMLLMLLKRLIIKTTRLAREHTLGTHQALHQVELLRRFNILVDEHFRSHKKVADYAEMLHKSPKTLTNVFRAHNQASPQLIIQERVVLEAKRMLVHTNLSVKEIAHALGYQDDNAFFRLFKKMTGCTALAFRKLQIGKK